MSKEQIPARTIIRCDACKEELRFPDVHITVGQVARDFQGQPVGGHTTELDFCDRCGPPIIEAMNEAAAKAAGRAP